MKTNLAAVCPKCRGIVFATCREDWFNEPETCAEIMEFLKDGFNIEHATTEEVRQKFGECKCNIGREMPWCEPCKSYHVVPRDKAHHAALQCFAPWKDKP